LRPFNCAQLIEMVESLSKYEGFFYRVTLRQAQCDTVTSVSKENLNRFTAKRTLGFILH
jgi:uncharacterized protein YifN (PemK superfamily)